MGDFNRKLGIKEDEDETRVPEEVWPRRKKLNGKKTTKLLREKKIICYEYFLL